MDTNIALFDIAEIPYFPYEPGINAWGMLIVVSSIIFFILLRKHKKTGHKKSLQAVSIFQKELQDFISNLKDNPERSKEILYRASLAGRRLISSLEYQDFSNMSEKELQSFIACEKNPKLSEFLHSILQIEASKYQPMIDPARSNVYISNLLIAVKKYHEEKLSAAL